MAPRARPFISATQQARNLHALTQAHQRARLQLADAASQTRQRAEKLAPIDWTAVIEATTDSGTLAQLREQYDQDALVLFSNFLMAEYAGRQLTAARIATRDAIIDITAAHRHGNYPNPAQAAMVVAAVHELEEKFEGPCIGELSVPGKSALFRAFAKLEHSLPGPQYRYAFVEEETMRESDVSQLRRIEITAAENFPKAVALLARLSALDELVRSAGIAQESLTSSHHALNERQHARELVALLHQDQSAANIERRKCEQDAHRCRHEGMRQAFHLQLDHVGDEFGNTVNVLRHAVAEAAEALLSKDGKVTYPHFAVTWRAVNNCLQADHTLRAHMRTLKSLRSRATDHQSDALTAGAVAVRFAELCKIYRPDSDFSTAPRHDSIH